jgi:GTP cyclohydrolase II
MEFDITPFLTHLRAESAAERPVTTLAYAQSLDGSLTRTPGSPTRISSDDALTFTHRLRAAHEAILVGVGTVLSDNPRLNVRRVEGPNPRPIVMDSRLRTPLDANLFSSHPEPWIATTGHAPKDKIRAFEDRGVCVIEIEALPNGWVNPASLQTVLQDRGVKTLMVEGGAHILTSFLQHRLADYLIATVSMQLIGGLHSLLGLPAGYAAPKLSPWHSASLGADLLIGGNLQWS